MLTTAQLRSPVFDRLTGRLQPKLVHPTAKAWDFAGWQKILAAEDDYGIRDVSLVRAAQYIGHSLQGVRENLVDSLFDGLSQAQIVEMAISGANRGWNIFRWKLKAQLAAAGADGAVGYLAALGREGIPVGPDGAMMDPDDANNALVDALPYWFAEAAEATGEGRALERDEAALLMHRGHLVTNLMQVFKAIWQEVLWEPWSFDYDKDGAELAPMEADDLAMWRAWNWREHTLIGQDSLLNRNLERGMPDVPLAIPLTATGIGPDGIEIGLPGDFAAASHRSALDHLQKSYTVAFLDEALGEQTGMTPLALEMVVCVLQDLVDLRLPPDVDPAELDGGDLFHFSCSFPRQTLASLIEQTLGFAPELASACLSKLTSDPFGPLGDLFTTGLWHRPLVRSDDGTTIMIVAGALKWCSPARRVERWLQQGADVDLTETPAGHRYEAILRETMTEAIRENPLFDGVETAISFIARGQAEEEIDFLLRIGGTIIVGEVKCLLGPSEPIERHNYIRKLEGACAQAARKTRWLADNPEQLTARLGEGADTCRLQPLVVVNQSNGLEWEYEGCPITDARFLELFLSTGDYVFGGYIYSEAGRGPDLFKRTMYDTAFDAETVIPTIFRETPVLDPFRESIRWTVDELPISDGIVLRLAVPRQDGEAYKARMELLLAEAGARH